MRLSAIMHPSLPYRMRAAVIGATAGFVVSLLAFGAPVAQSQVNVLTYHNDLARTGQNLNETKLTPATVSSKLFGKQFSQPVDGYIYAQPLYMSNVTVAGGKGVHNIVFVATEHDSVYAFDADSAGSGPLWKVSLIPPGGSTASSQDVGTDDIYPEIGITGTPVIDPATGTLYVVAKTKENGKFVQRLHALDITSGAEKLGGPVVIAASVPGIGDGSDGVNVAFHPLRQHNRAGLVLLNGIVYLTFASHGDNIPYHGWILGYNATTLRRVSVYNSTPNGKTDPSGYPLGAGGIWQAGGAPASDPNGYLYCMTGNGSFDAHLGGKDYGDAFIKLRTAGGLAIADYFAPFDQDFLNRVDADLGSGGVTVLPDSVGSAAHRHLLVGCGKEGTIYLVDRDNMGHFSPAGDFVVQTLPGAIGGTWSSPAYYNGSIYYAGAGDALKMFRISLAQLSNFPISSSPEGFGYPGATPSVSANGASGGIVWLLETDGYWGGYPAILRAYDASNVSRELFRSDLRYTDTAGAAVKFAVPTIANGKVFVGGEDSLTVYGLKGRGGMSFVPNPAMANSFTIGSLALSGPALAPGVTVNLRSSDPASASVTPTLLFPTGTSTKTFTVRTHDVLSVKTVGITATYPGGTQSASLTVYPSTLYSMSILPNLQKAGLPVYLTVWLTGPAPPGGATVTLTSLDGGPVVPGSITIPEGKQSNSIQVVVNGSPYTDVTVTGSYHGSIVFADVYLIP